MLYVSDTVLLQQGKLEKRKYFFKLLQISKKIPNMFIEKESEGKWISAVQIHAVQGLTIYSEDLKTAISSFDPICRHVNPP